MSINLFLLETLFIFVSGFNATSCEVDGLDQYWNYTVDVTAYTRDNFHMSYNSKSKTGQAVTTREDRKFNSLDINVLSLGKINVSE